ncbi:cyclopropane fatty acyl phospholipid synthase [Parendozoicomonas haliclonae]|uniref:Cyclopropane-fatty-acyl-phospholipid synthase n=1 Tax=Parendozoicomonas haliclonae TaxID=1960125 RepID=A0A1X7ALB7_9GAMM|nr:cyclopropane fatty acyl phospholipid synthase [Parendozoicomonas haliclonae]SMA48182.1 Cyclopropane-fatty-acyl-phospholipid synthase [Parendozoicomonas haliclonae]
MPLNSDSAINQTHADAPDIVETWLEEADIKLNGPRAWDITVHNPDLLDRIKRERSMGLGESYMEGWWDCDALDELFFRLLMKEQDGESMTRWQHIYLWIVSHVWNQQSVKRAFHVGEHHYDTGNELFERMLDPYMQYSCGYWKNADNLAAAQQNKLDLICRKLKLEPGMTLLDIGCGWGGLAHYAAEKYGVAVVGITVSKEQQQLILQKHKDLPITVLLEDYRELEGHFDRIVSVGMFEHVGLKNYQTYFKVASKCLKPDGIFLLHTIGGNITSSECDPWIQKYIFPNGKIPSAVQISQAYEGLLVMEDWHNFGPDYDKTLMAWHKNFEATWPDLIKQYPNKYDQTFYRMWRYYLQQCAGAFRARALELWQIVFRPTCAPGRYDTVR